MSFGSKALQILQTVAPTVALAVGGPFGPLASAAISAALGTPKGDDKAAEAALLSATPDQLLALTKENDAFQTQMKQLGIEEQRLVYDDIANARSREITLKDQTPRILAYLIIGVTFGLEGTMLFHGVSKDVDPVILGRILGTLDTATGLVLAYIYGSSAGSASKTDALNKIAVTK